MNPSLGILLKVTSVVIFTAMTACVKAVTATIPVGEIVFFRSFFAIVPIALWMSVRGEFPAALATDNARGHVVRGLAGTTAMFLGFLAVGMLPLPEAIAIGYASPLLATVFAALFLGEAVRVYRWTAVAVGLCGVLVILSPRLGTAGSGAQNGAESLGAVVALAGATASAIAVILIRKLVRTERSVTVAFWFSVTASIGGLLSLALGWKVPTATEAVLLILAGLCGGTAQIFMTESYRHAETATIAPFDYTSMVFGLAVAWAVFGEVPEAIVLTGAAIVIAAGLYIIYRERQLGIERAKARRAATPTI